MSSNQYDHLIIKPSSKFIDRHLKRKRLGWLLGASSAIRYPLILLSKIFPIPLLQKARWVAGTYSGTRRFMRKATQGKTSIDPLDFSSSFGYTSESQELDAALHYKRQLDDRVNASATESFDLYEHVDQTMSDLLNSDPLIEVVSNFGVSYAHIESVLAAKFPAVQFVGIDRSELTQQFNIAQFPSVPNLCFQAGDIFDYLGNQERCGVLMHMRTCVLMPKDFLQRLYRAAAASNVKYIVGYEQVGWSWETDSAYRYSDEDQESVVFRGFMSMHNYPGILKEAGYLIQRIELLKTAHPDEDYRIISFAAVRRDAV